MPLELWWWVGPLSATGFVTLALCGVAALMLGNVKDGWVSFVLCVIGILPWVVCLITVLGWVLVNILIAIWGADCG